ncbi:hypothetical protein CKA32_003554 [Geitlerinema sp. FC II]|nr:hypothetical protein CKA32_003554 [Geitlerinema sp. FC II]
MRSRSHPPMNCDRSIDGDGVTRKGDESLQVAGTAIAEAWSVSTYP